MIQTLDKNNLELLRKEINQSLSEIGKRHGIKMEVGKGSYTVYNATMKVEIAVISNDGVVKSKERIAYLRNCSLYGLKPEWLDKSFVTSYLGEKYKIVGFNARAHKQPVICAREDGKLFKFSTQSVKLYREGSINLQ